MTNKSSPTTETRKPGEQTKQESWIADRCSCNAQPGAEGQALDAFDPELLTVDALALKRLQPFGCWPPALVDLSVRTDEFR